MFVSSTCFGQRLLTGGSADQQRAAFEQEADWNIAKKLSNRDLPKDLQRPVGMTSDFETMEVGQVGDLAYWHFKVESIIDEKNMLLQLGKHTIWLEGYRTEGLVTDQAVRIIDRVEFTKTKSYPTVAGSKRTVRVFKMLSVEELKKQDEEAAELARIREEALYEMWHSKAGTEIEAKFLSWKSGKVELQKKDGKKLLVALDGFTADDATKLRKLIKEFRSKNK